jgi:hypothetical protein
MLRDAWIVFAQILDFSVMFSRSEGAANVFFACGFFLSLDSQGAKRILNGETQRHSAYTHSSNTISCVFFIHEHTPHVLRHLPAAVIHAAPQWPHPSSWAHPYGDSGGSSVQAGHAPQLCRHLPAATIQLAPHFCQPACWSHV